MSKKIVPLILLIAGLGLAIWGFTKQQDTGTSLEIGDLEISAKDEKASTTNYVIIGAGVVSFIAGAVMLGKSKG